MLLGWETNHIELALLQSGVNLLALAAVIDNLSLGDVGIHNQSGARTKVVLEELNLFFLEHRHIVPVGDAGLVISTANKSINSEGVSQEWNVVSQFSLNNFTDNTEQLHSGEVEARS